MRSKQQTGFTIVELLIVIVVIAILAAISIVAYTGIQDRARAAAHQQEASQVERQILVYAATSGDNASDVNGKLIGYQKDSGQRDLIRPLAGTPDITMYMVCTITSTAGYYIDLAGLTPDGSTNRFRFQTGNSNVSYMGYRIDTSAQGNASHTSGNVRIVGNSVIGWLQVSSGMTIRSYGYNQATPYSVTSLNPGVGFNFTGIKAPVNTDCSPKLTLVFDAAHNQATRAAVIGWLAEQYTISL